MQKKWKKPELIVLEKGQMQEAVLSFCKAVTMTGSPDTGLVGQTCGNPQAGSCMACAARPPKGS